MLWLYTELPLEPSLSRTLMEANEYGCLSQALTVAAMLSAETTLLQGRRLVQPQIFYDMVLVVEAEMVCYLQDFVRSFMLLA